MSQKQINEITEKHKKWLNGQEGGGCAGFSHVSLKGIHLTNTDLRDVDFQSLSVVKNSDELKTDTNLEIAKVDERSEL